MHRVSPIDRDVAIMICSRGREAVLSRLLSDLRDHFTPALDAAGLSWCIWVYAQGYGPEYLAEVDAAFGNLVATQRLVVTAASRQHSRIGDVVHTAIEAVHERGRYRLAMLMDDDSVYYPDPAVDRNLQLAARRFIDEGYRAYSIKLGDHRELEYVPFLHTVDPIMPFKEKMLWVSRPVLDDVLAQPRFRELSIGEDAVIAALAWLSAPQACLGVFGIGTFLHLGFEETPEFRGQEIEGGYADLMEYRGPQPGVEMRYGKYDEALRSGVTPYHVMPDVFVPEDHRHYEFNGVRPEVMARVDGGEAARLATGT